MARIQVLTLPALPDSTTPFVLVIDQAIDLSPDDRNALDMQGIRDRTGARAVLILDRHIDVVQPGNEASA
jgi:hypothetical protein